MDRPDFQELIRGLRNPDETIRLRAATLICQEPVDNLKKAVPTLKDSFLNDPNPAVRYLLRKALENLGVNPDRLAETSAIDGGAASEQGMLALQGGGKAFWLAAQDYLRSPFSATCQLLKTCPSEIGEQIWKLPTPLPTSLLIPHMLEIMDQEGTLPGSHSRRPMATMAKAWHTTPREALYLDSPETDAELGNSLATDLWKSTNPFCKAMALRWTTRFEDVHERQDAILEQEDPLVLEAAVDYLVRAVRSDQSLATKVLAKAQTRYRPGASRARLLAIAYLVQELAHPVSLQFVKSTLPTAGGSIKAILIDALHKFTIPEDQKLSILQESLKDPDPEVSSRALVAAWGSSMQAVLPTVIRKIRHFPGGDGKKPLAKALGDIGDLAGMDQLLELATDGDLEIQQLVIQSLLRLPRLETARKMVERLTDPNPRLSAVAFRVLVELSGNRALDVLRRYLVVEEKAASPAWIGLTELGPPGQGQAAEVDFVPFRLQIAEEGPKIWALESIEKLNDPKVMKLVETLIVDKSPRVQALAARILWSFGEFWVADNVTELLRTAHDPRTWSAALQALAHMSHTARSETMLMRYPLLRNALRTLPTFSKLKAR